MDMIFTESKRREKPSNIVCFGYDDEKRHLVVRFRGGAEYRYLDVPRSAFDGLQTSESAQSYLNQQVKPNYKYERLGLAQEATAA